MLFTVLSFRNRCYPISGETAPDSPIKTTSNLAFYAYQCYAKKPDSRDNVRRHGFKISYLPILAEIKRLRPISYFPAETKNPSL